jgi:anti-sigma factor RsiW
VSDHARHSDDVGAYLLGALNDLERQAFERHLAGCRVCQEQLQRLRPAAEALPGTVTPLDPPPDLKARLMAEVNRDTAGVALVPRRPGTSRLLAVAAVVLLAVVVGFGVAQLGGGDETRTVRATVANVAPRAGADLEVSGDGGTLRLHGMPELGGDRVYQVWLQHGDRMDPTRTFEVDASGSDNVELPNLKNADGVFVTREPRGGARVPSENPIVSARL